MSVATGTIAREAMKVLGKELFNNEKSTNFILSHFFILFSVVGGGLTSAATCSLIAERTAAELTVWDKARGAGGRMSTSRSSGNPDCTVDLGAQYISASQTYAKEHE